MTQPAFYVHPVAVPGPASTNPPDWAVWAQAYSEEQVGEAGSEPRPVLIEVFRTYPEAAAFADILNEAGEPEPTTD